MVENVLLYFIDLIVIWAMVFKSSITIKNNNLKMLWKILETIYGANAYPEAGGVLDVVLLLHRLIRFAYQMILLVWYTPFFDEVAEYALEGYYYQWTVKVVNSPFEEMAISPFEILVRRRQKMHFQILLL